MGEYLFYKKDQVKIGTCEDLYYTSYQKYSEALKAHLLTPVGSTKPEEYVNPDSGFRFRFPFPDEDKLPFGEIIEPFNRGVPIKIDQSAIADKQSPDGTYELLITQQKLVHRKEDGKLCLVMVLRRPDGEAFRIEGDKEMKQIVRLMIRHHIIENPDLWQKQFYREIAARIMKGYSSEIGQKQKPMQKAKTKRSVAKGRRKGLS